MSDYINDGFGNAGEFGNDSGYGNAGGYGDGELNKDFLSQAPAFSGSGYNSTYGAPYDSPSSNTQHKRARDGCARPQRLRCVGWHPCRRGQWGKRE